MSQSNWRGVRDAIGNILVQVPGISIVHNFPRLAKDRQPNKWISWMRDRSRVNAWTIFRENTVPRFGTSKQVFLTTNLVLAGMLQHDDEHETQDEFDELLDIVLETFYRSIHVGFVDIQGPAALRLEELRLVGDTAVHYAEIALSVLQTIDAR